MAGRLHDTRHSTMKNSTKLLIGLAAGAYLAIWFGILLERTVRGGFPGFVYWAVHMTSLTLGAAARSTGAREARSNLETRSTSQTTHAKPSRNKPIVPQRAM